MRGMICVWSRGSKEEEGREETRQGEQALIPCKEDFDSKEVGATEGCRERKEGSSLRFSQGPSTGQNGLTIQNYY